MRVCDASVELRESPEVDPIGIRRCGQEAKEQCRICHKDFCEEHINRKRGLVCAPCAKSGLCQEEDCNILLLGDARTCALCKKKICRGHSHLYRYPPGDKPQTYLCESCNTERAEKIKQRRKEKTELKETVENLEYSPALFCAYTDLMEIRCLAPATQICRLCTNFYCDRHITITTLGFICPECRSKNRAIKPLPPASRVRIPDQPNGGTRTARVQPKGTARTVRIVTTHKLLSAGGAYLLPGDAIVEIEGAGDVPLTKAQYEELFEEV